MLTKQARQTQQTERILEGEVFRFHTLGQRSPLGFGVVITHLAPLHIRPVLAEQHVDEIPCFRVLTKRFRPIGLLFQDELSLILIQIRRCDLLRECGLDQFFLTIVADPLGLEVSPKATDPHHTGETLQIDGSGCSGVNVALPLLNLVLKARISLEETLEIRQPLHLAVGDLIQGVLHPCGEAGIHQIREMLLQQRGHGKGREAWSQGIPLLGGISTVDDRAND